jgi:hypothetical protein
VDRGWLSLIKVTGKDLLFLLYSVICVVFAIFWLHRDLSESGSYSLVSSQINIIFVSYALNPQD